MNPIEDALQDLIIGLDALQHASTKLKENLIKARNEWPDYQRVPGKDWKPKTEIPPAGVIWASNGISVWLINSTGEGISPNATQVKYWSEAYIPEPPQNEPS